MKMPHCPDPEWIVRFVNGEGTGEETEIVETHLMICADCRGEMATMQRIGPIEAWTRTRGTETEMPEDLWRNVAAARSISNPAFRIRIGAAIRAAGRDALDAALDMAAHGSAAARDFWVTGVLASVQIKALAASPVRGAMDSARGAQDRVRAITGEHDMLLRRGADRLTVLITRSGIPAEGRRLVMSGGAVDQTVVTDSSGTAVFRKLVEGDYDLEIEGIES